ncbi:ATP-binding cassette domain-containing protein [Aeromicrobium sp. UC242_57]|uniref:ATP-binding cassette domain-containing protein n=1 Tax=Aeromicrobium sp. UC242_57 TaxID=3374624 RepID=UPI0037B06836
MPSTTCRSSFAGSVTGFLGPNGSGKSTTMRLMLGLDRGDGVTTFDGQPFASLEHPMRHVGALLEAKPFHPTRRARNHLRMLAVSNGISDRRVDEVLELVGLQSVARGKPGKFSLGMGQRLGIASALLGDPHTLILDEPSNGLDPQGIQWLRTLLKHLAAEGRSVFVSSHLLQEMAVLADGSS